MDTRIHDIRVSDRQAKKRATVPQPVTFASMRTVKHMIQAAVDGVMHTCRSPAPEITSKAYVVEIEKQIWKMSISVQ